MNQVAPRASTAWGLIWRGFEDGELAGLNCEGMMRGLAGRMAGR